MSDLLDLMDAEVVPVTEGPQKPVLSGQAGLQALQDELLEESAAVVAGALRFAQILPTDRGPSAEWVERYGKAKADEMFRLAVYGQMTAKEAPVGLKIATATMTGIAKAQALTKKGPRVLNMTIAVIPMGQAPVYPELIVEEKK